MLEENVTEARASDLDGDSCVTGTMHQNPSARYRPDRFRQPFHKKLRQRVHFDRVDGLPQERGVPGIGSLVAAPRCPPMAVGAGYTPAVRQ
jgi:hypothetical protein